MPESRGEKFRTEVLAGWTFDPAEALLLDEVAATIDQIDALPADAIIERRQQRLLLARLVGQIALPPAEGERPRVVDGKSLRGRRAAEARWRQERDRAAG